MQGPIKILGHTVPLANRSGTTPHDYVRNWALSDKDPKEHTLEDLNMRMQNRWPGNYKIVQVQKWNDRNYYINDYIFEFDTPKDETWFKLRYT